MLRQVLQISSRELFAQQASPSNILQKAVEEEEDVCFLTHINHMNQFSGEIAEKDEEEKTDRQEARW